MLDIKNVPYHFTNNSTCDFAYEQVFLYVSLYMSATRKATRTETRQDQTRPTLPSTTTATLP